MKKNTFAYQDQKKLFWLMIFLFFLFTFLGLRLIDLQLVRGQELAELAEKNRYFSKSVLTERALIFDRYQQPLVKNHPNYYRLADPQQLYSQQQLIDRDQALFLLATDSAQLNHDFSRVYIYSQPLAHVLGYVTGVTAADLVDNQQLNFFEQFGRMGLESYFDNLLRSSPGTEVYEVDAMGNMQQLVSKTAAIDGESLYTTLDPFLSAVADRRWR